MTAYGATYVQLNDVKPDLIKSADISDYFGNATEFMTSLLNGQGIPYERITLKEQDSRAAGTNLGLYVRTKFDNYNIGWQYGPDKFAVKKLLDTTYFTYSVTGVDPAILMPGSEYAGPPVVTCFYEQHKGQLELYHLGIEGSAQGLLNRFSLFELQQKIAMLYSGHITRAKVRIEEEIIGNELYFIKYYKAVGRPFPTFQDHLIKNRLGTFFSLADKHGIQRINKLINDWRVSIGRMEQYDLVVLPPGSSYYHHFGNDVTYKHSETGDGVISRLNDPFYIAEIPGVTFYETPAMPKSPGIHESLTKLSRRQVIANNFFIIDGSDAGEEIAKRGEPLNVGHLLSVFHMDQSQGDGVWKRYGVANGLFRHTNKWDFNDPEGHYHPMMIEYLNDCNKNGRLDVFEPYFWRDTSDMPRWWLADYVGDQDHQFRTLKYDEVHGEHFHNKVVARYGNDSNMDVDQLKTISEKLDKVDDLLDPDLLGWILTVVETNLGQGGSVQTNTYGFVNLPKVRRTPNGTVLMYVDSSAGRQYPTREADSITLTAMTDDVANTNSDIILPPFYPYGFGSIAGMKTLAEASKKAMFGNYPGEWQGIMKTLSISMTSLENLFQMTKNIYPNSAIFDEQMCPFHLKTGNSVQNSLYAMYNICLAVDGREPLWLRVPRAAAGASLNDEYWKHLDIDGFLSEKGFVKQGNSWSRGAITITLEQFDLALKILRSSPFIDSYFREIFTTTQALDKYEKLFNNFEKKSETSFRTLLMTLIIQLVMQIVKGESIDAFRRSISATSYLANSLALAFRDLAGKDFNVNDKISVSQAIARGEKPDLEQELNVTSFNAQFPPIMAEIAAVNQTNADGTPVSVMKSSDYVNTHLTFMYSSWKILSGMVAGGRVLTPMETNILGLICPTNPLMITEPMIFDPTSGAVARDYFLLANTRQSPMLDEQRAPRGEMTPGQITPNALNEYRGIVDMMPYELYVLSRFNPMWRYENDAPTTTPVLAHHLFERYMHFRKNRSYHSSFMKTGIMAFLFSRVSLTTHQNMADAGLPPMSSCFVCIQPKIRFYTVSAYWLKKQGGIIFYRDPDLGLNPGFDATHKKYVYHYTAWMGAVIPDPNDAIVVPHVMGDGYIGGMDAVPILAQPKQSFHAQHKGTELWWGEGTGSMMVWDCGSNYPRDAIDSIFPFLGQVNYISDKYSIDANEIERVNNMSKKMPSYDYYSFLFGLNSFRLNNNYEMLRAIDHGMKNYEGISFRAKHRVDYPHEIDISGVSEFGDYGPQLRNVMDGNAPFTIDVTTTRGPN